MRSKQLLWSPAMPAAISKEAPSLELKKLEQLVHAETNLIRSSNNLNALAWSDTVAYIARMHSDDMATQGYFDHINKEGHSASERAAKSGLAGLHRSGNMITTGLGENLFATHRYKEYVVRGDGDNESYDVNWKGPEEIAQEAISAWMNSPRHQKNLLSNTYSHQGIGIALGTNGTLFVTQNLY
ncbi:MAG: CAP domain-containing protein [Rhodothermales bacterium]